LEDKIWLDSYFTGMVERSKMTTTWPDTEECTSEQRFACDYFLSLVGGTYNYYGCDNHMFKLDDVVFEPVPDPQDGYRSMLGAIEVSTDQTGVFYNAPLARVKIMTFDGEYMADENGWGEAVDDQGYRLVDVEDGHVWLQFGTGNYGDYYPYFMFRHYPKKPPSCNMVGNE
jgi:hypothetical protein